MSFTLFPLISERDFPPNFLVYDILSNNTNKSQKEDYTMNNRKEIMMQVLWYVAMSLTAILMCVTVLLQIFAFDSVKHTILCSCIILLSTVTVVFDGVLKEKKRMLIHTVLCVVWVFILIMGLS